MNQPANEPEGPSLTRRVLLPVGALGLLAGVALGAFYLMHTFAAGPDGPVANATAPAKAEMTVAAAAHVPAVSAEAPKVSAAAGQEAADRVAAPAASMKTAAVAPQGAVAAAVKVPAPDNARWGDEAAAKVAAAPQPPAEEADAAPEVNDPQSAPVPTEEPKMATPEKEAPKAQAPKKLAYAAPSQATHPVDKAVTAALPSAGSSKETALPGVDPSPLSVPAKASAGEADNGSAGYASTVTTDVRLHAGPSKGSRSIGVVPRKATVQVLSCQGWCKVSYAGKEGYVYKSFLGHAAAPAPSAPEKTAAAPAAETQQNPAKPTAAAEAANAKALQAASDRNLMRR